MQIAISSDNLGDRNSDGFGEEVAWRCGRFCSFTLLGRLAVLAVGSRLSDAVGTTVGAVCGTSTVTTFVESASGVAEGGRTGLTSLIVALLFLVSLFFAPLFLSIPSAATTSALVLVGVMMMKSFVKIDMNDWTEAVPCFVTIIMMPLAYSISEGIVMGLMAYVAMKVFTGRFKDLSITMYVLAALFVLRYVAM